MKILGEGELSAALTVEAARFSKSARAKIEAAGGSVRWIDGEPADVDAIVGAYADWLQTSQVPKLFIRAEPGAILSDGPALEFCRGLPAQSEVTVPGIHFLQEDAPDEIGRAIADWLRTANQLRG